MPQQLLIRGGQPGNPPAVPVECGANGATVANSGPWPVYYRDEAPVTAFVYDGTIASGASVTLYGAQYLTVDRGDFASPTDTATVFVSELAVSATLAAGAGILNLSTVPTSGVGVEGQWAFNSATGYLYGPKVGTSWGNGYPLNGEEVSLGGGLPAETMMDNYAAMMQNGGRSMSSGRYFGMRHRPKRTRVTTKARFIVTTAASADDTVEIAVFGSAVGASRLAYLTATTGKLNSTGVKEVALSMTWDPSVDYYAVLRNGTLGGTAASLAGRAFQSAFDATLYGTTPPLLLCGYNDGTMPTTMPSSWQTSLSGFPLMWFVE